ncbi:MAG: MFS transporter [Bacteroidota bacterium]
MVNFIGILGYSIIFPILIFMVEDFGGNGFIYGVLGSTYSAFQLVGAPILGRWSDNIGRKKVLIVSQAGTFLAWILFIVAVSLPNQTLFSVENSFGGSFLITLPLVFLFIARALDGLTGGNVSVANAYLSDVSTDDNRKANFGKMASSTSLGLVLGPAVSGLLASTILGSLLPVLIAALISLIAIVVIKYFLPESKQNLVVADTDKFNASKLFQIENKECYEMKDCPDLSFWSILKMENIALLFLIYFLTFLGFSLFYASFPIYASTDLQWTSTELGLYLTVLSGIMIVVQGPILTYLSSRVSDRFLIILGCLLIGINFFVLPIGTFPALIIANISMAFGNGLMWPSFLAVLAQTSPPFATGTIQGYGNSMGSLASIFGLILGGLLFGQIGPIIFWLAGAMMIIILLICLFRMK